MTTQQTALEHLRVIRSLLEKSQVYRAVSAPAALCGGLLALVASFVAINATGFNAHKFLFVWLAILGITSALNFFLLHREASSRSQPFFSEGMRMALRAFLPPMFVGGVLGVCLIWFRDDVKLASLVWILCYGLALLSTSHFSPRSLVRLGWAFLIVGSALTIWYFSMQGVLNMAKNSADSGIVELFPWDAFRLAMAQSSATSASIFLGATFGLLHIAYAVAVFVRKPATQIPEA